MIFEWPNWILITSFSGKIIQGSLMPVWGLSDIMTVLSCWQFKVDTNSDPEMKCRDRTKIKMNFLPGNLECL